MLVVLRCSIRPRPPSNGNERSLPGVQQTAWNGLIPVPREDGSISLFTGVEGEGPLFVLEAPYMADAAGEESTALQMDLAADGTLTLTADAACPGTHSRTLEREEAPASPLASCVLPPASCLRQWPVQIKLVPVNAPYFNNANLLVAADCAAYAYGNFHASYMKKNHPHRLPKARRRRLQQEAHGHSQREQYQVRDSRAHGGACCGGIEQAIKTALQDDPLAGGDNLHGRARPGGVASRT